MYLFTLFVFVFIIGLTALMVYQPSETPKSSQHSESRYSKKLVNKPKIDSEPKTEPKEVRQPFPNYVSYTSYQGVPIPQESLKTTNEKTSGIYNLHRPIHSWDYFNPYGYNPSQIQKEIVPYTQGYPNFASVPFIGKMSSFAPFPEVNTRWEKMGILQTKDPSNDAILNLYRRPIAPLKDLFEYTVQDKDGFVIPLEGVSYLEDGDTVKSIDGKESLGEWTVRNFVNKKWIIV